MELGILLALTTLVVTMVVLAKYRERMAERHRKQEGIRSITHMKNLISLVQAHRGQSSALLNGDASAAERLSKIKPQIAAEIGAIKKTFMASLERWESFADHWHRLSEQGNTGTVANNFEQHTNMIRNLAYLLEDAAEGAHLTADFIPNFDNVGYVWRELVQTTENIGQCRAIGTGVAVQQNCSSVDKIRLSYLIKNMNDITENTLQNLSCLPEEKTSHDKLVNRAIDSMKLLITVVSNDLLSQNKITMDSKQYFQLATDTMTDMNHIFEHQLKQLDKTLNA